MQIRKEIFEDFITCKYKTYLKLKGKTETKTEYEILQKELNNEYKNKITDTKFNLNSFNANNKVLTIEELKAGKEIIINALISYDKFTSHYPILEKAIGKSKLGNFYYTPTFLH